MDVHFPNTMVFSRVLESIAILPVTCQLRSQRPMELLFLGCEGVAWREAVTGIVVSLGMILKSVGKAARPRGFDDFQQ